MLCTLSRARGPRGCRTRASAVGGLGAARRGVRHGDPKAHSKLARSRHIHPAWAGLSPWALVFLLLLVPRLAFASPSLEVDGNFAGYDDGEEYKGYVVVDSPDNYQSTLCLIGEYGKLIQITTEQYEKLSNPGTGGAFYELSQLWRKIGTNKSGTDSYYPQWLSLSEDFSDGLVAVYGYGRVWAVVCTDSLKQQAKEDLNTILDGGTVGGGSGGGGTADNTEIPDNIKMMYTGNGNSYLGDSVSMEISDRLKGLWDIQFKRGGKYLFADLEQNSRGNVWVCTFDYELVYQDDKLVGIKNVSDSVGQLNNGNVVTYNNGVLDSPYLTWYSHNVNPGTSYNINNIIYLWPMDGSGEGGGDEPSTPSPDPWEPPAHTDPPSNPTLPTPKDPITTDPPTLPGPPSDPTTPAPPQSPTVGNGGTYSVDLQGILDALDEHCIHIQTCLNSNFSGQNNYLGQLFSTYSAAIIDQIYNGDVAKIEAIQNAKDAIVQGFDDLFDYWDEYVKWLDKKLDFKWPETDTYDDEDLLTWLRKIWARQGTGDVNTRPVDPATNYSGFGKWLGVLAGEIEGDVSDTTLSSLTSAIGSLQHTFPFSLPWDIQQILQALDATPVTPSASIPMLQWGASWDSLTIDAEGTYSYDVDLHWLDSAMVAVRAFELLAFVLYCLIHTKDVFGYVVGE